MRIRLRFTEDGKVRFVSHRDVARIMERALRRTRVPVAYTEGFSPRPKLSFGLALSVGHESWGEFLDVEVRDDVAHPVDLATLPAQLSAVLPDGLVVTAVSEVDKADGSLQQLVTSCEWDIEVVGPAPDHVETRTVELLTATELPVERERKGKTSVADVRPVIRSIETVGPTPRGVVLAVELATAPVAVRPAEFVALYGPEAHEGRVLRRVQWIETDDGRHEPLRSPDIAPVRLLDRLAPEDDAHSPPEQLAS